MAQKSGLQEATVAHVLTADKRLKAITNDMWLKRAKYGEISRSAQDLVDLADTPKWAQAGGKLWDLTRQSATLYHGGVFPFTHERNLVFAGPKEAGIFLRTVKRAYSYASPNVGKARWSEDMARLQLDPDYSHAVRMGLDIKPGSEPIGILSKGAKGWGRRGFDALKPGRLELWKSWADSLPDDMKTEESGRLLAREANYATGAVQLPGSFSKMAGKTMFAPKLWFARRMEAFQPLRYLAKGGKMTPAERAVSNIALKRWGKIVGVTASVLAANDAFNKYVLKNDKRVNWSDFSKPGSLWRMNVGGMIIPLSPMVEVIRTPVAFVAALMSHQKDLRGEAPLTSASRLALKDFLNALHPSITGAVELVSGREAYGKPGHLRRLPFPGVAQLVHGEEKEKESPISWGEYLAEKGPIPISAGTREFVQTLRDEGASPSDAEAWTKALLQSGLSGGLGLHSHPDSTPAPKRGHSIRSREKSPR